jgi:trafficking kinesin-binding protein 1
LAEVEIVSLVQELIPRYRLRADTDFACSNEDFIQTPRINGSDFEGLTNTQIRALLDYYGKLLFFSSFLYINDDSLCMFLFL